MFAMGFIYRYRQRYRDEHGLVWSGLLFLFDLVLSPFFSLLVFFLTIMIGLSGSGSVPLWCAGVMGSQGLPERGYIIYLFIRCLRSATHSRSFGSSYLTFFRKENKSILYLLDSSSKALPLNELLRICWWIYTNQACGFFKIIQIVFGYSEFIDRCI